MSGGWAETPSTFGREDSLVGTLCVPDEGADPTTPLVVFLNAGIIHRTGPARLYVQLARALAQGGFPSLRFDLSGIGDSGRSGGGQGSLREGVRADIGSALEFASEASGARRFVLLGLCSGADHALDAGARRDDVVGTVLLDLNVDRTPGYHVRHYLRRVLRPRIWWSVLTGRHRSTRALFQRLGLGPPDPAAQPRPSTFATALTTEEGEDALRRVVGRGAPILAVFTGGVEYQYNHRGQMRRLFSEVPLGARLTELYRPTSDHTFTDPEDRAWLIRTTVDWMTARLGASTTSAGAAGP